MPRLAVDALSTLRFEGLMYLLLNNYRYRKTHRITRVDTEWRSRSEQCSDTWGSIRHGFFSTGITRMDVSTDSRRAPTANGDGELSPLEQEVLDEYAKLAGNLGDVRLNSLTSFLHRDPNANYIRSSQASWQSWRQSRRQRS